LLNLDLEPEPVVYQNLVLQSNIWAVFGEEEFAPWKKFKINVGLRHDHYPTFGGSTNPRTALIFNPDDTSAIKVLYGQAFRAPNIYELYWRQAGIAEGNPSLYPEKIRSTEVVYERNLPRHWTVSTQAFYYSIRDMITQQLNDDGDITWRNFGRVRAAGWEAEVERKTASGFETRLSYAFQHSTDQDTGQRLSNSPSHVVQAKIGKNWFGERFWTGMDLYALSSRLTLDGSEAKRHLAPNMTIGTGKPIHGFDLSATMYNVTNANYGDPGSDEHRQNVIMQDGRTFKVSLTYRLPGERP